jgi:TPR repeat protein
MSGCSRLALAYVQEQKTPDFARARDLWERACTAGNAQSCSNLGLMYNNGDGVGKDRDKALALLKKSCDLGLPAACQELDAQKDQK